MPIDIRIAVPSDMDAMARIRTSVRENHMSVEGMAAVGITPASVLEMLATTSRGWMASIDQVPAGFAIANAAKATVFAMFVHPDYEGRGIGKRLLAETESWLFAQGCDEIWLDTGQEPKIRAHGFYRRLGWILSGPSVPGELRYIKRRPVDMQRAI